jgi:ATP-dependent Clp protease ATP-binding subunit ClpC
MAAELFTRAADLGITVELDETAKNFIVDKGFDPKFGARPLRRAIQKYVEDPMAEAILSHDLGEADVLFISYDVSAGGEELTFTKKKKVKRKAAAKKAKSSEPDVDADHGSNGESAANGSESEETEEEAND